MSVFFSIASAILAVLAAFDVVGLARRRGTAVRTARVVLPLAVATLIVQMALLFLGHPLAALGFLGPISALMVVALFLIILLSWHDRVALWVSFAALGLRAFTLFLEITETS